jgi:hypothetical protein
MLNERIRVAAVLAFVFLSSCRNQEVKKTTNIPRQKIATEKQTIINSSFPVKNLFGIWTKDPNRSHADFELTETSFYDTDFDGNGYMPYGINYNKINVHYPDSEKTGLIKKAANDSLVIYWASGEYSTYLRWTK